MEGVGIFRLLMVPESFFAFSYVCQPIENGDFKEYEINVSIIVSLQQ